MNRRLVVLVVLVAAGLGGLVLGAATSTVGYWTGTDSPGAGDALGAPGVTVAASGRAVTIDVAAPLTGPHPESYTVTVGSQVVCTRAAPGRCIDAAGNVVRREYVTTARLGEHWTSMTTASVTAAPETPSDVPQLAGAPRISSPSTGTPSATTPSARRPSATTPTPEPTEVSDDTGLVTPHVTRMVISRPRPGTRCPAPVTPS